MSTALVWFRQDLRLSDNKAFIEACNQHEKVIPAYIYDEKTSVLGQAQRWWLHHSLKSLAHSLQKDVGLTLILRHGQAHEILMALAKKHAIDAVYWNRCYEPQAIARDKQIKSALKAMAIDVLSFNGSLLHEPWDIKTQSDEYYKVFTPYWKACCKQLKIKPAMERKSKPRAVEVQSEVLDDWKLLPALDWAAAFADFWTPGEAGAQKKLKDFIKKHLHGYKNDRNIPSMQATSLLSPHLHFGEISPWTIYRAIENARLDPDCASGGAEHFLSELGWREFSYSLLYHFPSLPEANFKSEFNNFPWHNDEVLLKRWQKGMTGYPIVDAGMRELWTSGYMHNRVRMIVASFLTKDLFIDWRLGAAWFLDTLLDADLANNSASWQWVAGSGADAAPYFRVFNPVLQSKKFDPKGDYIRRFVPELATVTGEAIHAPWESREADKLYAKTGYPKPIVDHTQARSNALEYYEKIKTSRQ